jgi:hypothetical protein
MRLTRWRRERQRKRESEFVCAQNRISRGQLAGINGDDVKASLDGFPRPGEALKEPFRRPLMLPPSLSSPLLVGSLSLFLLRPGLCPAEREPEPGRLSPTGKERPLFSLRWREDEKEHFLPLSAHKKILSLRESLSHLEVMNTATTRPGQKDSGGPAVPPSPSWPC